MKSKFFNQYNDLLLGLWIAKVRYWIRASKSSPKGLSGTFNVPKFSAKLTGNKIERIGMNLRKTYPAVGRAIKVIGDRIEHLND